MRGKLDALAGDVRAEAAGGHVHHHLAGAGRQPGTGSVQACLVGRDQERAGAPWPPLVEAVVRRTHSVGNALHAQVVALLRKLFAQAQGLNQAGGAYPSNCGGSLEGPPADIKNAFQTNARFACAAGTCQVAELSHRQRTSEVLHVHHPRNQRMGARAAATRD